MSAGRPKKYNEECKGVSLSLPTSLVSFLDNIAADNNITRNEVAINSIMASDKILVNKITKDIKILREGYSKVSKDYENLSKKLSSSTFSMIYQDIKSDGKINEFFKYFEVKNIKWVKNGITESELIQQYESWLYLNYKLALKNKSFIRVIFGAWIKEKIINMYKEW